MKTTFMETSDSCDNPIDLSRRCDSVETRKTPSPSDNSSSFAESSPSFESDLPSSTIAAARKKSSIIRSDTPPNSYQSTKYLSKRSYSSPSKPERPYAPVKHESSPPPQLMPHRHYKHESQQQQPIQPMHANDDEIDSYALHSAALHQKLQSIPAKASPSIPSSPESTTSSQYPMLRGRDGKLARPFKAYKHDTFSNPFASIPSTTDLLADPLSDERYMAFRQQMLEQIYAANGGQPTITNPKMRRTTTAAVKGYTDSKLQLNQQNEREFQAQSPAQQQNSVNCTSDSSEASCATNGKGPIKDSAYYERRRKNNAAAKKSRDRRREKEDNISIRCAYLERENMLLKAELETAKRHLARFVAP